MITNLHIDGEVAIMSSDEFSKARIINNWTVFSKADIDLFMLDVASATSQEDIEKAHKDMSKLVPKIIVDSIGRRKTVYVKPTDMIKKQPTKNGEDTTHQDALDRHHHNTKVQRMGKEASYKQVERHFGKEVTDKIREIGSAKPVEDKPIDGELKYTTSGGNVIQVHEDALTAIKHATGKSATQDDIDAAKKLFIKHPKEEGLSEKQSIIAFHRFLKTGDQEQDVASDSGDRIPVDILYHIVESKKTAKTTAEPVVKVNKTITEENLTTKIAEYADEIVKRVESESKTATKEGRVVDKRWRAGIENNFLVIKEHIDANDYGYLKEFMTSKFPEFKQFFEEYVGVKLPKSDKDIATFLFKHTGQ